VYSACSQQKRADAAAQREERAKEAAAFDRSEPRTPRYNQQSSAQSGGGSADTQTERGGNASKEVGNRAPGQRNSDVRNNGRSNGPNSVDRAPKQNSGTPNASRQRSMSNGSSSSRAQTKSVLSGFARSAIGNNDDDDDDDDDSDGDDDDQEDFLEAFAATQEKLAHSHHSSSKPALSSRQSSTASRAEPPSSSAVSTSSAAQKRGLSARDTELREALKALDAANEEVKAARAEISSLNAVCIISQHFVFEIYMFECLVVT
jgi:hypothetical protein